MGGAIGVGVGVDGWVTEGMCVCVWLATWMGWLDGGGMEIGGGG